MKKADSEFLREYYGSFTLDYEHVIEKLFWTRVFLAASVGVNLLLAGVLIVVALV
jgi:hypothetical protein